eukprot:TRINITY_DN5653_c0_g4_i2.p1 TRINITY_DN5653_c0_g4~~TRINITY_DN5653_c0_g4_i2.p1  ORF type:complete len:430 (+),score=64.63 TRINITY_DN5653_c0_g4_i2:179-1468(+)
MGEIIKSLNQLLADMKTTEYICEFAGKCKQIEILNPPTDEVMKQRISFAMCVIVKSLLISTARNNAAQKLFQEVWFEVNGEKKTLSSCIFFHDLHFDGTLQRQKQIIANFLRKLNEGMLENEEFLAFSLAAWEIKETLLNHLGRIHYFYLRLSLLSVIPSGTSSVSRIFVNLKADDCVGCDREKIVALHCSSPQSKSLFIAFDYGDLESYACAKIAEKSKSTLNPLQQFITVPQSADLQSGSQTAERTLPNSIVSLEESKYSEPFIEDSAGGYLDTDLVIRQTVVEAINENKCLDEVVCKCCGNNISKERIREVCTNEQFALLVRKEFYRCHKHIDKYYEMDVDSEDMKCPDCDEVLCRCCFSPMHSGPCDNIKKKKNIARQKEVIKKNHGANSINVSSKKTCAKCSILVFKHISSARTSCFFCCRRIN